MAVLYYPDSLSAVTGNIEKEVSVSAITAETENTVPGIGGGDPENLRDVNQLFDPSAAVQFVAFWIISPSIATGLSYLTFLLFPRAGPA